MRLHVWHRLSSIKVYTPRAHSTNAQHDFHQCQERAGLQQHKIDQDCPTRWRGSHMMADQLVYNKPAVLEMDKDPAYKESGEVWGKNKPNLEVMARQYLGCPATSASVERLFSKVCIAFSAKRKRSEAETLENLMFANANP